MTQRVDFGSRMLGIAEQYGNSTTEKNSGVLYVHGYLPGFTKRKVR